MEIAVLTELENARPEVRKNIILLIISSWV